MADPFKENAENEYEEALNAVRRDGITLRSVRKSLKTAELCLAAVRQDINAHAFAPLELQKRIKEVLDIEDEDGKWEWRRWGS